jgi:hypothetical protein
MTITSSSTSVLLIQHAPSDDDGNVSLDGPGRISRGSVQLYNTNITLMWPVAWQGMLHNFIKDGIIATSLYIFRVKMYTKQHHTADFPEKPTVAQLLKQFPVFLTTCQLITIFTTASLTHSQIIPLAHLSSVLKHISQWTTEPLQPVCSVHIKRSAETHKWGKEKVRQWQITEPLN